MKAGEFVRIIIFIVLGAALMFYLQPLIYEMHSIPIRDVRLSEWVGNDYHTGAKIVFGIPIFSTLLWYVLAATAKVRGAEDTIRWQVVWWLLLLLASASIVIALAFFNSSNDALISLTGFYILDVVLLFWLPTATSSPKSLMYVPPGSFLLRRLIGG